MSWNKQKCPRSMLNLSMQNLVINEKVRRLDIK